MFLLKAGTVIQVKNPFINEEYPWVPQTVEKDVILEKHQVWDAVVLHNEREELPFWATRNIQMGFTIMNIDGEYSMVRPAHLEYLD
jgi:hypothetical protein